MAEIAERNIERIKRLIEHDKEHRWAFEQFMDGLHKNINPFITDDEAIEMLSQHIITQPVFEALFDGYSFVKNNPISQSMQAILDLLESDVVNKDTEILEKFYDSVRTRADKIDNAEGKQKVIIELYDKFFNRFPEDGGAPRYCLPSGRGSRFHHSFGGCGIAERVQPIFIR